MESKFGKDLAILAFPCDQFGGQELKSDADVQEFANGKGLDGTSFTLMARSDVNGAKASPVWSFLKGACDSCGGDVRWNFAAKFYVDKQGSVVKRSGDNDEALIAELIAA